MKHGTFRRREGNLNRFEFIKEYVLFRTLQKRSSHRFSLLWKERYPCLRDNSSSSDFDRHYVYHTAWAARVLAQTKPELHVDISSSLYFSSIVSAFVKVASYDYRPADIQLSDLSAGRADLLALPFANDSVTSLSCMHVVEHVGLGRYGDPLDTDGDLKAIAELTRVLARGGDLLFVVPVGGTPKIMFNAHRIYSYDQIVAYFGSLELVEFALIPEDAADGGLVRGATRELADRQKYGCGCFRFRKTPLLSQPR